MFQRRRNADLPTTSHSTIQAGDGGGFGLPSGNQTDGSGRAIRMDAPLVKAWKKSSSFTKGSYYVLSFFVFLVFVGYRYMRYWNASIWLTCQSQECTLEVTPPGHRTYTAILSRRQLLSAQGIKTDKKGKFLSFDDSRYEPPNRSNKGKKTSSYNYKGPDENGEYRSYAIKFKKPSTDGGGDEDTESDERVADGDYTSILGYLTPLEDEDAYMLYMRQFGLSQSRTRIRSNINKVESYVKKRRQKLLIKESVALPWQGILCLVFGLLGIMMTLLIGQFWDEAPKKHGGPGARRTPRYQEQPKFFVDTGRPSKYPPGYKKY